MLRLPRQIVLFCLIVVTGTVFAAEPGKKYAVLIGVEDYQHPKLRNPKLSYPIEDVTELGALLKKAGYEVVLLTDEAGKKDKSLLPNRENVDTKIREVLRKCRAEDTVILVFAGHGLQFAGQNDAYFCPLDARPFADETETLVSVGNLYRELEKSFAGTKVLLVDACRNDPDPGRGRGIDGDTSPRPPRGIGALFSCSAGERAFEHDDLKHGVFFHHVLKGFEGEAADRQGDVTFESLASHVRRNVPRTLAKLKITAPQSPNLKADLIGIPPVLFRPGDLVDEKLITNSLGMKLALIPAGEFQMGGDQSSEEVARIYDIEAKYFTDEHPQHRVRITKLFYLGQHEVTQEQWQKVMNTTPWKVGKEGSNYPATYVSWEDATAYCKKLTDLERKSGDLPADWEYRLPTEAQWEYACRVGTKTAFHFGNDDKQLGEYAWFVDNAYDIDEKYAHEVGLKKANPWGLYDMHGNVGEWCADWFDSDNYGKSPVNDPTGPEQGSKRVNRGGCWFSPTWLCRSAFRGRYNPSVRYDDQGFRVARVLSSQ